MAYIKSKKVYAILINDPEGRKIIEKLNDMTDEELEQALDEFFGKGSPSYKGILSKKTIRIAQEEGIDLNRDYLSEIDTNEELKGLRNSPVRSRLTNDRIINFLIAEKGGVIDIEDILEDELVIELEKNMKEQESLISEEQEKGIVPLTRAQSMNLNMVFNVFMKDSVNNSKAPKEGKAVIVIGPPASGKSSAIEQGLGITPETHLTLDSDDIKKLFKEYDEGKGAPVVHNASSLLHERAFEQIIKTKINLAIPIVGKSRKKIDKFSQMLKDAGYQDVEIVFADLPIEKAMSRNFARLLMTGRHVPFKYMNEDVKNNPEIVYNEIKGEIENGRSNITNYRRISTDVSRREKPKSVENSREKRNR